VSDCNGGGIGVLKRLQMAAHDIVADMGGVRAERAEGAGETRNIRTSAVEHAADNVAFSLRRLGPFRG
jgi:hypothetical protein